MAEHRDVGDVTGAVAPTGTDPVAGGGGFSLDVEGFSGPFDLLLRLLARRELDVVALSLSAVTDEFISYVQGLDGRGQLEKSSEFIWVAATLLDIKIAELLPRGEVVDPEDVAALEARDLLFARLLQYRAFKEVSAWFSRRLTDEARRHARTVAVDVRHYIPTPQVRLGVDPGGFAAIALAALTPRPEPEIGLAHLHSPRVSIREQAGIVVARLRRRGQASFGDLVADAATRAEVVARFLAVLELYRSRAVAFEQVAPLGALEVRWVAETWDDDRLAALGAEYDREGHEEA